jgi:uncharacterized protein (TIGR00661 family)
MEFYPILSKYAEVDVLISGIQGDLKLPFEVKYIRHGISYIFGKDGGIDYLKTVTSLKLFRYVRDLINVDLDEYDLIVSDFEPLTAWASKFAGKKCVGLSHQAAFLSTHAPRPKWKNLFAEYLFHFFAPCSHPIGLHYQPYDDFVYTPVVRKEIRDLELDYDKNLVLVYLPAYDDHVLIEHFSKVKDVRWRVFSKHTSERFVEDNVEVNPVGREAWLEALRVSASAITGAGFAGTSEMLFLHKRLLAIPMPDQYEQLCNAIALDQMGVTITRKIDEGFPEVIKKWLAEAEPIEVDFPYHSEMLVQIALGVAKQT